MIRISALNDSSDDESQSISKSRPTTKEAQESAALSLYNRALDLLKRGDEDGAKDTFLQLLEAPFIKNAEPSTDSEVLVDPGLVVKYSSYKNLGSMAAHREEYQTAMAYYLEAVMVDSSDVTVWYKVGTIALKIHNYPLARHAFEQGLVCQPRHWPCLDNVITVLYALYNYDACLVYIARALERDPGYIKGISFMEKILEEQPSLRRHMGHHFTSCDQSIFTNEVDQDEADEYIEEALAMRKKKQDLCQPKERPMVKFTQPLTVFTWHKLGSCLISLYDHIASSSPPITYSCKVDLSGASKLEEIVEQAPTSEPAAPSTTTAVSTSSPTSVSTTSINTPVEPTPTKQADDQDATINENTKKSPDIQKEKEVELIDAENSQSDTSKLENIGDSSREKDLARRGSKRRRFLADSEKRRSARVRNTGSKQTEDQFKIQDVLVHLLPTSMTQVRVELEGTESSQEEPMDVTSQENSTHQASQDSGTDGVDDGVSRIAELKDTERAEVLKFIETHQSNSGIIDLLNEFLITLAQKIHCVWPEGLSLMYTKAYTRLHKHIEFPGYLCKDESHERIRTMAKMGLVHAELKVDRLIGTKSRSSPPKRSGSFNQGLGPSIAGPFFHSDLVYLEGVSQCQDIFDEEWANFIIRVFWMSAKFRMLEGKTADSISDYECTAAYMEYAEKEAKETFTLTLPHIVHDNEVTLEKVKQQVDLLKRCQSQDKMQGLHDSGEYSQVIQLLLETFENPDANKVLNNQERHAQLLLLVESLLKMKDFKRCIIWGEVSLDEALQKYNVATSNEAREEWAITATQLMDGIDKAITADQTVIRSLTSKCLVRFTQNLMLVIEASFDVHESAHEMGIATMLPWTLIYKLIYFEECQQAEGGEEESFNLDHSGSLSWLETAHEQLGRRSWCCNCDGALLLFIVSEIVKQVRKAEEVDGGNPGWGMYDHILEQCFFCLYGHPNRRRAKHLQDHSSSQISLTWARSIHVFEYFKPQTMPEYDSLKTSTVSGELEALLRRIYIMIPTDAKLPLTVEQITSYIEGTSSEPPDMPEGEENKMPIVGELYYLLADYYFKNKEQGKAIKFYLQDLCVNPDRFDSWAGMALARASRLEQKLSLSELKAENKTEGSIWKHAIASLRCFQRALQLDNTNSKLWIEYGALAYQLHAHASRQLKQLRGEGLLHKQVMYPLTGPSLEEATSNRTEMLTIAGNCYRKAGECEVDDHEEEWLHHYMLGKVAEKKGEPPGEYLEHYKQALHYLHEDRARYPRKITYIYSPPHLAVETLEVFYRLHVSIIKYMLRHTENIPYSLFETYIKEAAEGPFATCKEKEKKPKERDTSLDESSNSNMLSPIASSQQNPLAAGVTNSSITSTPVRRANKHHSARMDHTYSIQGSLDSSRSDAENSNEAFIEASLNRRTVTNQRTGVAISASDSMDSMQSPVAVLRPASPAKSDRTATGQMSSAEATASKPQSDSVEEPKVAAGELKSVVKEATAVVNQPEKADVKPISSADQVKPVVAEQEKDEAEGEEQKHRADKSSTSLDLSPPLSTSGVSGSVSNVVSSTCQLPVPTSVDSISEQKISSEILPDTTAAEELRPSEPNVEAHNQNKESCAEKGKPESSEAKGVQEKKNELAESMDSLEAPKGLEELEKQINKESLFQNVPMVDLVSEGSSQDSTTVAELEKLKSEISFLNSGSSDIQSYVFSDTYDDMIKVEKEESAAVNPTQATNKPQEEESKEKEDEDNSQNKALEALKSELQQLSAASGSFVVPDYIGQGVKTEPNLPESQGFDVSDLGLNDSQESMDVQAKTENDPTDSEVKMNTSDSLQEISSDDLTNLERLESSLERMKTEGDVDGKEMEKIDLVAQTLEEDRLTAEEKGKVTDAEKNKIKDAAQGEEKGARPLDKRAQDTSTPVASVKDITETDKEPKAMSSGSKTDGEMDTNGQKLSTNDAQSKEEEVKEAQRKDPEGKDQVLATERDDKKQQTHEGSASGEADKKSQPPDGGSTAIEDMDTEHVTDKVDTKDKTGEDSEKGIGKTVSKSGENVNKSQEGKDNKEQYKAILSQCMKALVLCLSRFPHHYKSLYRMAYIYYHSAEFKNNEFARDMLLGNLNWSHLEHMASPGLFQDRKSANFFQGLWRIPIEEIDRSGSFACHMLRSLQLLFPILKDLKDHRTLYSIHMMLSKNPDAGKKYLRDSDRIELSRLAIVYTIDILEELVPSVAKKDREEKISYLLDLYKVWQYGVKTHQHSHILNKLMRKAYFSLMKEQIEDEPSVLEQAICFCQKQQDLVIKSPTTPEPTRSLPGTPGSYHPLSGVSGSPAFQSESPRPTSDLSMRSVKGITPIAGTSKNITPGQSKPLNKMLKPCSVRLTTPPKSKLTGAAGLQKSGQISKSTSEGLIKKLTVSNVPKKAEVKRTATSTSTGQGSAAGQKSTKTNPSVSNASMYSGFTAAQLASLGNTQAAMYAKLAQMSPQAFLQAQYGAAQEAMMSQMALASSLGIPLASMGYMYPQMAMDPAMWSSYIAAQAFAEAAAPTTGSSSPGSSQRHNTTTSSATTSTATKASSSAQRSASKESRPAPSGTVAEPPRKMAKTETGPSEKPLSLTTKDLLSSNKGSVLPSRTYKPLSLTKEDKPVEFCTKSVASAVGISSEPVQSVASGKQTSLSSGVQKHSVTVGQKSSPSTTGLQKPAKMKLSTTVSELYAVRMSSALARMSNTSSSSAQGHQIRGPPPKVQRISEPSQTSSNSGNLSHLDLLASAAQTHGMLSQTSPQAAKVKSGLAPGASLTFKGAPSKTLSKRSPHYRPNRGPSGSNQARRPQSKTLGVSQASKQAVLKPPPAHMRSVPQIVPGSAEMPSPPAIEVKGTVISGEMFKTVKSIEDLKANIKPDFEVSGATGRGQMSSSAVFKAQKIPPEIQRKLAAQIQDYSTVGKPSTAVAQPRQAKPQHHATSGSAARPQVMKKPTSMVNPSNQPLHSRMLAQHLTAKPKFQPPLTHTGPRQVVPSGTRPDTALGSGPSESNPQPTAGGFGRGKPSHPATLASRIQEDSSSDDCIVISSGGTSDSD